MQERDEGERGKEAGPPLEAGKTEGRADEKEGGASGQGEGRLETMLQG